MTSTTTDEPEPPIEPPIEPATEQAAGTDDDGRTRCAWVRGHPAHFAFHDAEWGRTADTEEATFERVLLTCLSRDRDLVEVLDARDAVYEAFCGWDKKAVADLGDGALDDIAARGGVFADRDLLGTIREVAGSCVEAAATYKPREVREYFLALRYMAAEERLVEAEARFPRLAKEDVARLLEMLGIADGGAHQRDCWRA